MDDADAIVLCQRGNLEAYRHLVEHYQTEGMGHALAILGHCQDAEDASDRSTPLPPLHSCWTSFINLLGFEKALLAVAFGLLALKSLPGPALTLRRRWAKAGVVLGPRD